jgi:hypothetical protein
VGVSRDVVGSKEEEKKAMVRMSRGMVMKVVTGEEIEVGTNRAIQYRHHHHQHQYLRNYLLLLLHLLRYRKYEAKVRATLL